MSLVTMPIQSLKLVGKKKKSNDPDNKSHL